MQVASKAVFTQRSLSDLTLDRSKFMSDKFCLNTLNRIANLVNRIGKPKKRRLGKSDNGSTRLISLWERCSFLTSIPDGSTETIADLAPNLARSLSCKMALRANSWNREELRTLVELWADESIQSMMDSKQKTPENHVTMHVTNNA